MEAGGRAAVERLDVGVLGPLQVAGGDGPIPLPAAKQRALLALLLLSRSTSTLAPSTRARLERR